MNKYRVWTINKHMVYSVYINAEKAGVLDGTLYLYNRGELIAQIDVFDGWALESSVHKTEIQPV